MSVFDGFQRRDNNEIYAYVNAGVTLMLRRYHPECVEGGWRGCFGEIGRMC